MLIRNKVLAPVIALLLAITTPAAAQDYGSKTCMDKNQAPATPAERQKPYAEYEPVRSIAPRDLPPVSAEEADRAQEAAEVVAEFRPNGMIDDAKAIAVIPGVKKAAFGFGGRWGKGLITMRDRNGNWIPPSYITISGGSFGFQIGAQSTDLVLVFTDENAVNALLRGKLTLNADASAAVGPFGRDAQAGVPILMNSGILAFSRSKGLFAGVSLDGAAITVDDSSNAKVYGRYINGDEILLHQRVEANTVVAPFLNALDRYTSSPIDSAAH